jgi:ribose-phosphate pyrophosphokinase
MLVLGFPEYETQARALAAALQAPCTAVEVHRFPDGESRVRLPTGLPEHTVLYRSLDHPNEKLVELMLAARCARELGARRVTLVAPYLCYMRQDVAFRPGEAVSQRIVGQLLADISDSVITADPHLHRVSSLEEAIPAGRAIAVSAAPVMGSFLAARSSRALLVGPDRESEQWVGTVAGAAGLPYVVADKTRRGDRDVNIHLPDRDYAGLETVLVDDLASTGRTLAGAARALREAGAARVDVLVSHALFVGDALEILLQSGVSEVWSSDSVSHPSNAFSLAPQLAAAIV